MNYVIVDDEKRALNLLTILLNRIVDFEHNENQLQLFQNPLEALDYVRTNHADILFLDIEMPNMNGVELGRTITGELADPPKIIYVTAYSNYSLEAWDVGAFGYIMKPYDIEQIRKVLERTLAFRNVNADAAALDAYAAASGSAKNLEHTSANMAGSSVASGFSRPHIHIRCFPNFDIMVDGAPIPFKNKRAKELLALLVHFQGGWVSLDQLTFNLMEECEEQSSKNYLRVLRHRLNQTLDQYGLKDLVEIAYGSMRVNTDLFTCDYYDYLAGNTALFNGSYMEEYSWSEISEATMHEKIGR